VHEDKVWDSLMRECPSLAAWNQFIVPLMKVLPKPLLESAALEAKRRGYKANKEKGCYE